MGTDRPIAQLGHNNSGVGGVQRGLGKRLSDCLKQILANRRWKNGAQPALCIVQVKASDNVPWSVLCELLQEYGVFSPLLRAI